MFSRLIASLNVNRRHHRALLHETPLYYENFKVSSVKIKKITINHGITGIISGFKNNFFNLKFLALAKEAPHGRN